jgi:hypothetical protein
MNFQEFELLPDNALRRNTALFLNQEPHTEVHQDREGIETHTPSREGTTVCGSQDLNPSTVVGTTIYL